MTTTAFDVALRLGLPSAAIQALKYNVHPQERTQLFHEIFDAPIHDKTPDMAFSHMDNQRVAFRVAFIISEAFEILEKGLGLTVGLAINGGVPDGDSYYASSSDNAALTNVILAAMMDRGPEGRNVIEVVDGLGDLNVVVNGFALELGVNMRAIDQEVLASNLSKLGDDGTPIVADGSDPKYPAGKILKGPKFIEPQIGQLLGLPS